MDRDLPACVCYITDADVAKCQSIVSKKMYDAVPTQHLPLTAAVYSLTSYSQVYPDFGTSYPASVELGCLEPCELRS